MFICLSHDGIALSCFDCNTASLHRPLNYTKGAFLWENPKMDL